MDEQDLYTFLLTTANDLRRDLNTANPERPQDVSENIEAAIVYLDCARQNLSRHMNQTPGAFRVIPTVVLVVKR